jgi:hypothetical protein
MVGRRLLLGEEQTLRTHLTGRGMSSRPGFLNEQKPAYFM